MNIIRDLGSKVLHVAQPIASLNGRFVEVVETELGTFYAVVFEGLQGKHVQFDEISSEQAYQWGRSLGIIPENLKQFPEENQMNRPSWRDHLSDLRTNLPTNEISFNWYVADIVFALRDAGEFTLKHPTIASFMEGYKSETILDEQLLNNTREFERLHKLISFGVLLRTVDLEVSVEYPEWLIQLANLLTFSLNKRYYFTKI